MRTKNIFSWALLILMSGSCHEPLLAQSTSNSGTLRISMQKRLPSDLKKGSFYIGNEISDWKSAETAIIICDMWDRHWCKGAEARVAELAPVMNNIVKAAREKGVLIVHAPSDCMDFYKNQPARKLGQKYKSKAAAALISNEKLPSERNAEWPVDQSNGGCDCSPECKQGTPWTRQTDLIEISDNDAISDSGAEIVGLFSKKGIKNVILMGVHTNMCVIERTFGLRNMVRSGFNVVLMRDMTDTMYDSKQKPNVNHFTGNSLVNEYIEKFICPTIVSTDFTGKKQFRFKDDTRPVIAFLTAENEYNSNLTLPEFGHDLMLTQNVNCEFAVGKPQDEGDDRYNMENLQILEDASLAVVYVRRRGFVPEKMNMIKDYVARGNPVLGLRTASHAFDPRIKPNQSNPFLSSLSSWPEFDKDVLGGNYEGHTDSKVKSIVTFSAVPGMQGHALLKDVPLNDFTSTGTLYSNQSLKSENAQVILVGTIPGEIAQPVLWINNTKGNHVIYTSIGTVEDFQNEKFVRLLKNSVSWLLEAGSNKK